MLRAKKCSGDHARLHEACHIKTEGARVEMLLGGGGNGGQIATDVGSINVQVLCGE